MNLQEVLKKDVIGEEELAVLSANMDKLSLADKIRFGFAEGESVIEEEEVVIEKPKRGRKAAK